MKQIIPEEDDYDEKCYDMHRLRIHVHYTRTKTYMHTFV